MGRCATPRGCGSGKVDDLIVRLGEDDYPPVTGVARDGRRTAGVRAAPSRSPRSSTAAVDAQRRAARSAAVRAPAAGGAAEEGRPRPAADQRRRCAARAGERDRDRPPRRLVPGRRRRHGPARDRPAARAAAAGRHHPAGRASSTGRASSRSPATCRRCGCASRIRSSRAFTRPSSPTSSRPRRTARARRSSTPSRDDGASRPTCSRSSTRSTRSSSSRTGRDEEVAERARADGDRRRGRPARRPPRGAPRGRRRAAAAGPAPARPRAARLRPGDRRRPDEPRVRLRLSRRRPGEEAIDRGALDRLGRHARLGLRDEPAPPAEGRDRARRPAPRRPGDAGRRHRACRQAACEPTPSSKRSRG